MSQQGGVLIAGMPKLPLTAKPAHGNWGQQEYVAAMARDIGFTDHKPWWHYRFRSPDTDGFCVSVYMDPAMGPQEPIVHTFEPNLDWIDQARTAVAKIGRAR